MRHSMLATASVLVALGAPATLARAAPEDGIDRCVGANTTAQSLRRDGKFGAARAALATSVDASCPATAPQASQPCDVKECTLCNVGGNYLDSTGASKVGYCVCPPAGGSGTRKWSCASATAWPCPSGQGC